MQATSFQLIRKFAICFAAALVSGTLIGADVGYPYYSSEGPLTAIEQNRNVSDYNVPVNPIYTGRSPYVRRAGAPVVEAPAPRPKPVPVVAPPPPPPPPLSGNYLVNLVKRCPSEATLGETYCCEIIVTPGQTVGNVVVADVIPEGTSLVNTDPQAQQDGRTLTWKMASMQAGESKSIKVCLKAEREGELAGCATVSAVPMTCASTMVGKPVLAIEKTGPAEVREGDEIVFSVRISNKGTAVAKNVVATDLFPEGTTHWSGERQLSLNLGDLAPGASTTNIPVRLKTTQRGKICNTASAEASNAPKVSAEACVDVVKHFLNLTKTTPDKSLIIGKVATYALTIENPGDRAQTGVMLVDTAAPETKLVAAPGATINGNTATWNVGTVEPGAKKTFEVKVQSVEPGKFCDVAKVDSKEGSHNEAQDCTEWIGVSGVLVELVDDPDPIQVGETSTYTIKVTNQGSTRSIDQMEVKIVFPAEMDPVSASNGGAIAGKTITFPVAPTIAPKASVTYTFVGKALKTGDARIESQVVTEFRKNPIIEVESTTIY